ncbi:MAG: hypothetical protein AAGB22_15845, partial [Bacteroidota bacterium]
SGAVDLEQPNRAVRVQANGGRQWRWPWSVPALEAKEVVDEADRVRFFLRYFLNHNRQREVQNRQRTSVVNPHGFGRGQVAEITPGTSEQQRTCLLLECTPRHEECFPHWVELLASLGYRVDIMAGVPEHVRDVMQKVEPETYRFVDFMAPAEVRAQGYDFVVLNSLLYRNIFPLETVGGFPDVSFVEALGMPSLTVIHSPMMWTRKRIVRTLLLQGPETHQEIYFIADGTFKKDDGAWQGCHWQEKGTQLLLTLDSRPLRFNRIADGQWRSENEGAWTLQEMPQDAYTPETHFSRERHQLVSLARNGAQQLRDRFPKVQWRFGGGHIAKINRQLPLYFGETVA